VPVKGGVKEDNWVEQMNIPKNPPDHNSRLTGKSDDGQIGNNSQLVRTDQCAHRGNSKRLSARIDSENHPWQL
jgi:hypothetical protein